MSYRKAKRDRGENKKGEPTEGSALAPLKQLEREQKAPKRATQKCHSPVQSPRPDSLNETLAIEEGLITDNRISPVTSAQASPIISRGGEDVEEKIPKPLKPPNRDFITRFQEARHREESAAEAKVREDRRVKMRNQKISMRKAKPALCAVRVSKKRKAEYMDDFNPSMKSRRVSYEDDSKMERDVYDIPNSAPPAFERTLRLRPSLRRNLGNPISMRDALRLDGTSLPFDLALNSVIVETLKDENEEKGIEEIIPKNNKDNQVSVLQNSSQEVGQISQPTPGSRSERPSSSSVVASGASPRKLPSFRYISLSLSTVANDKSD